MKRMMIRETTSLDEYSDESDSEYWTFLIF